MLEFIALGLRHAMVHCGIIVGDRATQECDLSTTMLPYGMGLVSSVMPTSYNNAGGYKAINSGLVRGRLSPQSANFFGVDPKFKIQNLKFEI